MRRLGYDAVLKGISAKNFVVLGRAGGEELRLAFHRHYYSLGEHYNSVVSAPPPEEERERDPEE